jgi:hypothetical protein
VSPRSFDAPRPRDVPRTVRATTLAGEAREVELAGPTLLVVVKPGCDGCRPFVLDELVELEGVPLVVLSPVAAPPDEWARARREILVAPEALAALEVRFPPVYLLVDPARGVLAEGTLFDPAQVAAEIAQALG